jgi:hypothetical protein
MKLRHPRLAVALAVGVVGLFTFGAVSSAGAATFPMKAFLETGQSTTMFYVQGASFRARCTSGSNPSLGANVLIARIVGTASNGITKVNGVDEDEVAYNHDNDDFDTGEVTDLLNDSTSGDGFEHEVGAQADYMGSGGSPIVNANYSTEQSNDNEGDTPLPVGANCAVWGAFETF